MASSARPAMSMARRAKQFLPFAALQGLPEALAEREIVRVPKIDLTEDMAGKLNRTMDRVHPKDMVEAVYYHEGEYRKITGMVARIDRTRRFLQIVDTVIDFDCILDLELTSYPPSFQTDYG